MKVLLLAGIEPDRHGKTNHALKIVNGEILLDVQIHQLQSLGLEVAVVLAGMESEKILRQSRRLEGCELIYDTHFADSTLISNLRSGLYCVQKECFALPVHIPVPDKSVWLATMNHFFTSSYVAPIHLVRTQEMPWPILVTPRGKLLFRRNSQVSSLADPSLNWDQVSLNGGQITSQVMKNNSALLPWTGRANPL